ncbi:hypothetical protein CRG98_015445, partial [Punica granatum]
MELDSIECVSTVDGGGVDDDHEIHNLHHGSLHNHHPHHPLSHHSPQFSASKPPNPIAAAGANVSPASNIVGPTAIAPATSVHELLECPVCTNSMYPPIHQCHNGHTLCSTCKTRVHNRCPTCRQELGDIRCLALEK